MKTIADLPEFDNHELISFISDKKTALRGFIVIHNTNLGPATGGTRYWPYSSEETALKDGLRLARAMTYKCALAGVPYGGGKAVLMADKHYPKTEKFLAAYAKRINLLNGQYYTGEDVGINQKDVDVLTKYSKFIVGRKNLAGELGPWASLGVFFSIKAALYEIFGSEKISGKTIAIKGLGKVGLELAFLIIKEGGKVIGADINSNAIKSAKKRFPNMKIVSPKEIHKQKVDVCAPCAMGGEFNRRTVKELRSAIICGGANNQLASDDIGEIIHQRGILYIPDYLANAGGLINVVGEIRKEGYSKKWVEQKVKAIKRTAKQVIGLSKKYNKPTNAMANQLAESIFKRRN